MKQIAQVKNKYIGRFFKYSFWDRDKPKTFDEMMAYVEAVKVDKLKFLRNRDALKLHYINHVKIKNKPKEGKN